MGARLRQSPYGQLLMLGLILAWGVFFTRSMGRYGEAAERDALFTVAATAAAALDAQMVRRLKGDATDNGTPELAAVRESLMRVRQVNPEARFIYLMRRQGGQFIFLADAEPETSRAYSPPGQVYDEQMEGLLAVLEGGQPVIEAPYQDSWGRWVSALAPVLDRHSGQPIAVLGLDISATRWTRSVTRYRLFALTISALFLGLVLLFMLSQQRQRRAAAAQARLNERLQAELAGREQLEERLRQMASVDVLTGIPNRRVFDEAMHREWSRALREQTPLSLVMADLDFFKRYNDRHGHLGGDECLRRAAAALAGCVQRSTDVTARYGGEEFGLILPQTDAAGAAGVARRVVDEVRLLGLPHGDSDIGPVVTISAGHATLVPQAGQTPRDLIRLADAALYEAKRAGRNAVRGTPA